MYRFIESVKRLFRHTVTSPLTRLVHVRTPLVEHPTRGMFFRVVGLFVLASSCFVVYAYFGIYRTPALFPLRTIITISEGLSVADTATVLADAHVIRSEFAFRVLMRMYGRDAEVRAGEYYFDRRLTLGEVAERLMHGEYGLEPITVTVPEGATTYDMSRIFADKLRKFDAATFLMLARDKEGYLFPDTYVFLPDATANQVLDAMERTFYERIRTIEDKIATFGRPIHEVVTMASLLEKEASREKDRRTIAGVLWERLAVGMPLQVDAVFGYIERRATFSPKLSHLAADSPYNTYKYKGLPPGPIGSPSLAAIEAAVTPEQTNALFYLHGKDGMLYLARTFAEHVKNRRWYLDS